MPPSTKMRVHLVPADAEAADEVLRYFEAEIAADGVFLLTGYISDNRLLREAGVELDPDTCGPRHDPETYETNVKGLYVIGAMVAGKASGRIFIENGRFHGEVAIREIASRSNR